MRRMAVLTIHSLCLRQLSSPLRHLQNDGDPGNYDRVAQPIAEYTGIQNVPHVRKKLGWMAMITETVQMLGKQACLEPVIEFGMDG